jgi:hypothetical protein
MPFCALSNRLKKGKLTPVNLSICCGQFQPENYPVFFGNEITNELNE